MTQLNQNTATLQEILEAVNNLPDANSGGSASKLPSVIDKTVTEITAQDLQGAVQIGRSAFTQCDQLTSVVVPSGVQLIDVSAFQSCGSLVSVTLPDGVNKIGSNAFSSCNKLEYVNIPSSVTSIGYYAFSQDGRLQSITIPNGVTAIEQNTFDSCACLPHIVIPNSVASIGRQAFYSCRRLSYVDLTAYGETIAFPVADIGAFYACGYDTPTGTFEIRVPAGRKAELAAMTNWSTYADNIVEV